MNKVHVDLPKGTERRFLLPDINHFLNITSPHLERKRFSHNEYIRTIYFNNDQHVVPFETSIKARKYLKEPETYNFDPDSYFLDLKKGHGQDKEKIRLEATLEEATEIINREFKFSDKPLRPYILVEYLRQHYIPKDSSDIRLSVDNNLRYFYFFDDKKEPVFLGEENHPRLEIKEGKVDERFINWIGGIIESLNLIPIISKKFKAYNLLCQYHSKTSGKPFYKEIRDYEIESKLDLDSENLFQKVKQFFVNNSDFILPQHFPYTFESASINRYYRNDGISFKAMFLGDDIEIVRKSESEVLDDMFKLGCITKRKETKGEIIKFDSNLISLSHLEGELHRMRKAFWVENPRNNRIYHISSDCCLGAPGDLYQMEVEYTGRYGMQDKTDLVREREIVDDIAKITKDLLKNFPSLIPSQKTKMGWLGIKE